MDQQFMDVMGSPYLIAHGAGVPVADAVTEVRLPGKGLWHVYVRTFNWTSPWYEGQGPGMFQVEVEGNVLSQQLGVSGDAWMWEYAGEFEADSRKVTVSLKDLTGFDGRCDAIYFSRRKQAPVEDMAQLRGRLVKGYDRPVNKGE